MRTQVFSHKNYIGIQSDVNTDGLLNDPKQKGQLGLVIDLSFVDVSDTALKLLKKIKKNHGSLGDIMIFSSGETSIFSWIGYTIRVLDVNRCEADRDYNPSLIKTTVANNPPENFIKYIDSLS